MNTKAQAGPDSLTVAELVELPRIKERKVYDLASSGEVPHHDHWRLLCSGTCMIGDATSYGILARWRSRHQIRRFPGERSAATGDSTISI